MPPAVHRLSILLLPADPDTPGERAEALRARLERDGWLSGDTPGPRALVDGGFARARVEVFDTPRFASNNQGGFRVSCPVDGASVVVPFSRALERWRNGGPRALACTCGETHDLAALVYAPEAGFARGWLALLDVGGAAVDPAALALADEVLGGVRVVARRA
ncbi:MAG: hypothetical protein ACK4YP_04275 [Myxococcota bacterium]